MACKRSYRIGWASRPCPRLLASGCADGPELRVRLWLAAWSSRPPPAAPPTACPGDLLAQPSTQLVDRLGGWDYRARPGDTRPWRPSADHPPRLLGNVLVGCARWRRSVGASDGVTGRLPSFSRSRDLVDGAGWAAATGLAMSTDSREPCRRGERQVGDRSNHPRRSCLMASGTHVQIDGVGKRYGGVAALAGLDLELGPGITGLLGPNGAGKTTLIRILATLLAPSAGEVRVNGWRAANSADRVEIRRRLGYLPQDLGLYPRFTVFEFVDYLAILKELDDPADRHRRVRAALEAVELEDLAGRKIRTLSGGMRRRVGIAQAIVADPELLLLDEPTTGLDPEQRMRFRQLLAGLGERRTVVLSTHLVEDVAAVCTRVVVLWQGRTRFVGTPTELRQLADGQVWSSPQDGHGAVSSWRTETGAYRVLGPQPSPSATPLPPTVEDGYLLVCARSRQDAAA